MEARGQPTGRVVVIMPTYNERANIESTAARIRRAVPDAGLLVVDDNSPDGTGEIADKLTAEDSHIHVLHRTGKAGLGAAYIAGFRWALGAAWHGPPVWVHGDVADGNLLVDRGRLTSIPGEVAESVPPHLSASLTRANVLTSMSLPE